jgi:hypothetical protein
MSARMIPDDDELEDVVGMEPDSAAAMAEIP